MPASPDDAAHDPAAEPGGGLAPSAVEGERVVFRLTDPDHGHQQVRLWLDQLVDLPREFEAVDGGWALSVPLPPLGRIEYLFELGEPGHTRLCLDEANPRRVPGAFGDHSWLAMPGYAEPDWLVAHGVAGERTPLSIETELGEVRAEIWSPGEHPMPLLISHDGPEMDAYGGLTRFIAAKIGAGELPPMRVALLAPGARDAWYSANPDYARALVDGVLPALAEHAESPVPPVIMGQSLGALAALHAATLYPDAFAGLFLQSGSYFAPDTDPQESGFGTWAEICAFTAAMREAAPALPPAAIVCGTAEENLANNESMRDSVRSVGNEVAWASTGDGHTWSCWRDLLDPHLTRLLGRAWFGRPELDREQDHNEADAAAH